MVKCEICNKEFKNTYGVARHIRWIHPHISMEQYYEMYVPIQYCKCGCGEITKVVRGKRNEYVDGHNLKVESKKKVGKKRPKDVIEKIRIGNTGKKMSDEAKQKISQAQSKIWTEKKRLEASKRVSKENHPNWRGGRPDRPGLYRGNSKEQVQACRDRDNNTCQMCGATKEQNRDRNMCVHHIIPYYDSYDNSLDNLICLCEKCHPIADRNNLSKEDILNYFK